MTAEGQITYGAGDTRLVENLVAPELAEEIFGRVEKEVQWASMFHRGGEVPRLVAIQGDINEDKSFPIYRFPSDIAPPLHPFTPAVALIRDASQRALPPTHGSLNHVLIQFYRSGRDYISEHSDKTIDIVRGSSIVNVSLGAQRTMVLRKKKDAFASPAQPADNPFTLGSTTPGPPRPVQRIPLPHNSMLVMSLQTNQHFLHSIKRDMRRQEEKASSELANDCRRISLTFRCIGTSVTPENDGASRKIWGQGARGKTRAEARAVVDPTAGGETEVLLEMFGKENREADFDWQSAYGEGFDVVNFRTIV